MILNIKKKPIVGVSVTPGIGIEVAQIDYEKRVLLNYVVKPFVFDSRLSGNFDLDIFKETLYDALVDIGAPQGTEIVLNLPSSIFGVKDYPASIDKVQLGNSIEDEVYEHPILKGGNDEPDFSYSVLPNSTIQFNKVAYTAVQKSLIMEIAVQIRDLNYSLVAIDTSVNSTLNALIYSGRVDASPDVSWVMLLVENTCCRIISMQGRNYVDYTEEAIGIGDVLGETENYDAVIQAVNPVLKNLPSSLLYVISKTDVISAEKLASKLTYKAQIVHQEANMYNQDPIIELADSVAAEIGKTVSFDVIGAAIKKDFGINSVAQLNLFNSLLGDVYLSQVPPVWHGVELSMENMLRWSLTFAAIVFAITFFVTFLIGRFSASSQDKLNALNTDIENINAFLKKHEDISGQRFSEFDEIRIGLSENKNIFSYYTIVGTEIPKKLWLTALKLGDHIVIEGQADNLESVYSFFRNIKDYNSGSQIKLQKLGLAGKSNPLGYSEISGDGFDKESVLTSLNADFYQFVISDQPVEADNKVEGSVDHNGLPNLEPLE